ncbi:tRNA (adenosine(37)-N6)-threonylcarbamoyltransferase complex ATPase subunit type 1 TsaE [Rhodobacterales bacterium 52_120_T64]|nr:tRNA (adenosine(37)-N6)-threonylcarbamoyltransferase complex ATPase subunit type 1 TsaE [Rhodobacterales bacterium 52_120_T64]
MNYTKILETADDATALAVSFSAHLCGGDSLLLSGPVGAGKTHFARSIIQSIMARDGEIEDVPSPTFTLVQVYETSVGEVWHTDLYRLTHVDELTELGLDDAFETAITLVEWPDRLGAARPQRYLDLSFSMPHIDSDIRMLELTTAGTGWDWLNDV